LRDYLNVAIPYIYFYEGGPNCIAKLDGGAMARLAPLDPPLYIYIYIMFFSLFFSGLEAICRVRRLINWHVTYINTCPAPS